MSNRLPESNPEFCRPLTRRERPLEVIAELTALEKRTSSQVLQRLAAVGKGADRSADLTPETLVAVVRAYTQAGHEEAARQALAALFRRITSTITGKVSLWGKLTEEDKKDAVQNVLLLVLENARNLTPGAELWECNFRGCLTLRMISLWKTTTARQGSEVNLVSSSAEGEERDGLLEIADPKDTFSQAEVREFRQKLRAAYPHIDRMLHLRLNGYTDIEISEKLGVTDRTLRNWAKTLQAFKKDFDGSKP